MNGWSVHIVVFLQSGPYMLPTLIYESTSCMEITFEAPGSSMVIP